MAVHQVNTHEAKSRLSELIRHAEEGDTVILARAGEPVAQIIPWKPLRIARKPGRWKEFDFPVVDLVSTDDEVLADFDESLSAPPIQFGT